MKTIKDVAPYRVKYRVWDHPDDTIVFETDDWDELVVVYYANYTDRRYLWGDPHILRDGDNFEFRYHIKTEFGDRIPNEDLKRPRRNYPYGWKSEDDYRGSDIRYKKDNPNKIKRGYYRYGWWWETDNYYEFPYKSYHSYRRLRTTPEKRRNAQDVADYGNEVVRGRRRGKNLPDSYDDLRNGAAENVASWKQHSKRRKQWKIKE